MKLPKILGIVILTLLVLFLLAAFGYRIIKSQGVIDPYAINTDTRGVHILLAAQDRKFKNEVLDRVSNHFIGKPAFIQVIDVTELGRGGENEWDGFVILTTVQSSDIPIEVRRFLKQRDEYNNTLLLLTADSQSWTKNDLGIDAITSASKDVNIELYSNEIITFIENRIVY